MRVSISVGPAGCKFLPRNAIPHSWVDEPKCLAEGVVPGIVCVRGAKVVSWTARLASLPPLATKEEGHVPDARRSQYRAPASARIRSCRFAACRHDGMDNGSYDLADLNGDGHLDVVFSGSHAGFQGNWDEPYWVSPENPTGARKWIHYDFFTLVQQPPFDGRHWKAWEFNGGGAGCKRTSCVNAADLTGDGYPEVVLIGHASQRLLPPPYDRIVGALANLGHQISDQTVRNILKACSQNT